MFELPDECLLQDFATFQMQPAWAQLRLAWNSKGLAVQADVSGKKGAIVSDPRLPEASDGVHLWIDTRDARDNHRATRFCHRYSSTITRGAAGVLNVETQLRKIHRAAGDPTGVRPSAVRSQAQATESGWRMALFFPTESLHGFDPETNRRLGFYYQVTDPQRGAQWLSVGSEFPVAEDPSLWAALELI
jgi:hypothetical protein